MNVSKEVIMINEVIDGVRFLNLPARIDEEGKIGYPLQSWAIAEVIASKIDELVKPYVTIDLSTVDRNPLLLILNDGQEYVEPEEDPEKKLIELLFNESEDEEGLSEVGKENT